MFDMAVVLAPRPLPCVMLIDCEENQWSFRRYLPYNAPKCPANPGDTCEGWLPFDHRPSNQHPRLEDFLDDPRWPQVCDWCKRPFSSLAMQAQQQIFTDGVLRTHWGERRTMRQWYHVPGAMWNQPWLNDMPGHFGPDGLSLCVVCPDGEHWSIDGPASNCTMKDDKIHKCWVRHGTPPNLTVDKNGFTCKAGAGSIQTTNWHGFLRNGNLVDC